MPKGSGHGYAGVPASERTQARRGQLLDAALDLMSEGIWRSTTVAGLCTRAGLHKRYFYESFTDLDEVARAVVDLAAEAVATTALVTYASLSEDETLEIRAKTTLDAVIRVLTEDSRKAQILFGPVTASLNTMEYRALALDGLTTILVENARTIHDVELEADTLATVTPSFLVGGTGDAILAWTRNPRRSSVEQLVEDIAFLWLLTGNGAADEARRRIDAGQRREQESGGPE